MCANHRLDWPRCSHGRFGKILAASLMLKWTNHYPIIGFDYRGHYQSDPSCAIQIWRGHWMVRCRLPLGSGRNVAFLRQAHHPLPAEKCLPGVPDDSRDWVLDVRSFSKLANIHRRTSVCWTWVCWNFVWRFDVRFRKGAVRARMNSI